MTDDEAIEERPRRRRWKRWLAGGGVAILGLVVLSLALLPWLLNTGQARVRILAAVNDYLAPGSVAVEAFSFSYREPLRMEGFEIIDPEGDVVVRSPEAVVDKTLGELLWIPIHMARNPAISVRLDLPEATAVIDRNEAGEVDLMRALAPIFEGDPRKKRVNLRVAVDRGQELTFRDASLPVPFEGRLRLVRLHIPDHGGDLRWDVRLAEGEAPDAGKLSLAGWLARVDEGEKTAGDLEVAVEAVAWPIPKLGDDGPQVSGSISGSPTIQKRGAIWTGGGRIELTDLGVVLDPAQAGLSCSRIVAEMSLVELQPVGAGTAGVRAEATVEAPDGVRGLPEEAKDLESGPWRLDVAASYWPTESRLEVHPSQLELPVGTMRVDGEGREVEPGHMELSARGAMDLQREPLRDLLAEPLGLELELDGARVGFELTGTVTRDAPELWTVGPDLKGLVGFDRLQGIGLDVGPTEVVLQRAETGIEVAPFRTTLNGGELVVRPGLEWVDSHLVLRLEEGTGVRDAEINEELSQKVLAFAVPVLERATHPTGRVSALVKKAEIPVGFELSDEQKSEIEAAMVFDDVEFAPGPLAYSILELMNREDARMRLDQPVAVVVRDGRVHSKGLAVPLGDKVRFELDGSVGFDESLALVARLPITREMLGNVPVVSDVLGGTSVELPIGGTLDEPKLDKLSFEGQLEGVASAALKGAAAGLDGIGQILSRMREKRQERRQERLERRGRLDPEP